MLTSGQLAAAEGTRGVADAGRGPRWVGWLALLTAVLAVVVPFLPVVQHEATIVWPSPSTGMAQVNAPLVALRPESMAISVPCSTASSLDDRRRGPATVVSTVPPESPQGARTGLALTVSDGSVSLTDRGQELARGPLRSGGCAISFFADAQATTFDVGSGLQTLPGDARPQVVGVYSDLDPARDAVAGTSVRISPDTRFDTSPTMWKLLASAAAVAGLIAALWGLGRRDLVTGRRPYRPVERSLSTTRVERWRARLRRWLVRGRPGPRDTVVAMVLLAWMAIGGQTSDDGFTLGIARDVPSAGYVGNYFGWYHSPEAPFGWFYDLYALWVRVSDSLLWLRLPSVLMGLLAWWLVSRGLLPRLGRQVRRSRAAAWAAAGVFLTFWMAYDSGLRPEPVVVVFSLATFALVERAIVLRRLLPLALALITATLAVGANPAGLIALAPFLAAARPLWTLLVARIRQIGALTVLGPLGAAGTAILLVAFADQSVAAVAESYRLRSEMGPNAPWYTELAARYGPLFSESADGSIARRFPILLLILCTVTCLAVIVRRRRIAGASLGPTQRLIGVTLTSLAIFALTPTKWTHHFGALVGLGAAVAAVAALATGADMLRSLRNRLLFLAAITVVTALSFAGPNAWFSVNNWGVPWFDKAPSINGYQASTALLVLATVLILAAFVEHLRGLREHRSPDDLAPLEHAIARVPLLGHWWNHRHARSLDFPAGNALRSLRWASAPLALLCGLVVAFHLASMAKAIDKQSGSWSMGADALAHPLGGSCGLSSRVFAERRPVDGLLPATPPPTGMAPPTRDGLLPRIAAPTPSAPAVPTPAGEFPGGTAPAPPVALLPPGVVPADSQAAQIANPDQGGSGFRRDGLPPTGGGTGVSGYEYVVPGGLGGDDAPAYGSYDPDGRSTGTLRTPWVALSDTQQRQAAPIVVTAAGRLGNGNSLTIQYATRLPDGRVQIVDQTNLDDGRGDDSPWHEIRFNLPPAASGATEVRLVAQDNTLGPSGWLAVAPLRSPQLAPLSQLVADQPMFLEYPTLLASPCLRPFSTRGGIAELPAYHLEGDSGRTRADGKLWSSATHGGPLGWLPVIAEETELPTYLDGDPTRDWGKVSAIRPYRPDAVAPTLERRSVVRSGATTTGTMGDPPADIPTPER